MKVSPPPTIDPSSLSRLTPSLFEAGMKWAHALRGYPHWQKARFLDRPSQLDPELAWLCVRMSRPARSLPMKDKHGIPFVIASPDELHAAASAIDRSAAGQLLGGESLMPNERDRDRYIVSSLEEEAIRSSQLEGAAVTRRVAKSMLRAGRAPTSVDERMILNNFRAMEWIREHRSEPLSRSFVLELHSILTEGTLESPAEEGRFRRPDEDIVVQVDGEVVHVPPAAEELEERMEALCSFANGEELDFFVHPVTRSILLHFWLAYDHPFVDGNGRTARGLFYWSMLSNGYWLAQYISISRLLRKARARYGAAFLMTESDRNDTTYFVLHQFDVLQRAVADLRTYLDGKRESFANARRWVGPGSGLNHRQTAIMDRVLRDPETVFTIAEHQASQAVSYQTARTDLLDLAERGYLEQGKEGRALIFWMAKGLLGPDEG